MTDINRLLDPGPVLETYDPRSTERYDEIEALQERLRRQPCSDGYREALRHSSRALREAYHARFKYSWEYEAFVRELSGFYAREQGIDLPYIPQNASVDEIDDHYNAFNELCEKLREYRTLKPLVEWENGVFASPLPDGVERDVRDVEIPKSGVGFGFSIHVRLIVERRNEDVHVCAIQNPFKKSTSVMNAKERAAHWLAERYLPKPPRLAVFRGRRTSRRLFFYYTFSVVHSMLQEEAVWGQEVIWSKGDAVELREIDRQIMTPLLRSEGLKLDPELWNCVRKQEVKL